jgi:hypothetical protein
MYPGQNDFRHLCKGVARKDPDAVARFRHSVVPCLRTIVRCGLRARRDSPPLCRWIQAAYKLHVENASALAQSDESYVGVLAGRLCDLLIDGLQSAREPLPHETILGLLGPGTWPDSETPANSSP